MKLLKKIIFTLAVFFIFSFSGMGIAQSVNINKKPSCTIVFYLYQPDINPKDISFTIEKLEIKKQNGEWKSADEKPITVRSVDIQGEQILLTELHVEEGEYNRIRIQVSNASFTRENKHFNLALPQPDKTIEIGTSLFLRRGQFTAIFLNWHPNTSIRDDYLFQPVIKAEPQKLSPQSVLLYVANRGSNYISVIDRFENRVVAIIGVEEDPTGLVLSREQEKLYVLNSQSSSISIIDTTQDFVRDRIQLISGIEPIEMAMIPDNNNRNNGQLYIANRGSNNVTVVDTNLKLQITSVRVGNEPLGITANPDRQEVYVANSGSNSISIINSLTNTVTSTIIVDYKPVDVVIVGSFLYVLSGGTNWITVIDIASRKTIKTIPSDANLRKAVYSEQFDRVYLTNYDTGKIAFLIPSLGVITRTINVGLKPVGLAIDESRNRLYITGYNSNKVAVINPVSETVEKLITVGKNPYNITFIK